MLSPPPLTLPLFCADVFCINFLYVLTLPRQQSRKNSLGVPHNDSQFKLSNGEKNVDFIST